MKALVLLLLAAACAAAEVALSPQDDAEIRNAIRERARLDNIKGSTQVWSERGPIMYKVGAIAAVSADVATAEAKGVRTGTYFEPPDFLFLLTRSDGHWTIVRKVQVCHGSGPVRVLPADNGAK